MTNYITHSINGKPSGIIQPDTTANRQAVLNFAYNQQRHYGGRMAVKFTKVSYGKA